MAYIFEVEDITRKNIRLTERGWSHIQKHKDMVGALENIKDTLFRPHTIKLDEIDSSVMHYYRYYKKNKTVPFYFS